MHINKRQEHFFAQCEESSRFKFFIVILNFVLKMGSGLFLQIKDSLLRVAVNFIMLDV